MKLSPVRKAITVMERMSISSDGGYGSNGDTSNSVVGTISPSLGVGKSVEDTSGMFISGDSNNSLGLSDKYISIFKNNIGFDCYIAIL